MGFKGIRVYAQEGATGTAESEAKSEGDMGTDKRDGDIGTAAESEGDTGRAQGPAKGGVPEQGEEGEEEQMQGSVPANLHRGSGFGLLSQL